MSETDSWLASPGSVRPSQLITTFGPGSIMQLESDSVIIMGLDVWFNKETEDLKFRRLSHAYLEGRLDVSHFKTPRALGNKRIIPCKSFPTWGVCPRCSRLQKHKSVPAEGKKTFHCDDCGSSVELNPARFITICDKGHLDDFPWEEWAHSDRENGFQGVCKKNPKLSFWASGDAQTLADYKVTCRDCHRTRSCKDAVSPDGLSNVTTRCTGSSPWLGNKSQKCVDKKTGESSTVKGIQVRASSLYYPLIVSAIYIPKWLHPVQDIITEQMITIENLREANPPMPYEQIAQTMRFFDGVKKEYSIEKIVEQLEKRFSIKKENSESSTQKEIRNEEYHDLIDAKSGFSDKKKFLEIEDIQVSKELEPFVNKIKNLKRITELKVLRGFTRGQAPDPYSSDSSQKVEYCKISRKKLDWYPAVENRGEGIFFTLNEERLRNWEEDKQVSDRCYATIEGFEEWAKDRQWKVEEKFKPRYLLLHTLSHALIRGLANLSGYSEASIQERIYQGDNYNAILLYTSSSSSDGSLGGLVRQGKINNFEILLESVKYSSQRCSRDPLCAEDDPVEKKKNRVNPHARINGSACYGCVLLPETSCENSNRLLDRMLLFDERFGFFKGLKI